MSENENHQRHAVCMHVSIMVFAPKPVTATSSLVAYRNVFLRKKNVDACRKLDLSSISRRAQTSSQETPSVRNRGPNGRMAYLVNITDNVRFIFMSHRQLKHTRHASLKENWLCKTASGRKQNSQHWKRMPHWVHDWREEPN